MLTPRPVLTACLLTLLAVLVPAAPAAAGGDPPAPGGLATTVGTGTVTTTPDGVTSSAQTGQATGGTTTTGSSKGSGSGGDPPPCRYQLDDSYAPAPGEIDPHAGEAGAYYLRICGPHVTPGEPLSQLLVWSNTTVDLLWLPARSAPLVPITPAALAAQAVRFLPLPAPAVHYNPHPAALVQLPTWLWVEPSSWGTRRSVVAVPGLSVTVTATPTSVTWRLDPAAPPVLCRGAGTAYRPDRPDTTQHTACTFRFQRSSAQQPGHAYPATATTSWAIRWRASNGFGGALPALQRTSRFTVPVREVQTVITEAR